MGSPGRANTWLRPSSSRAGRPARVTHAVPVALRAGSAGQAWAGCTANRSRSRRGRTAARRLHLARAALHGHRGAGVLAGQPRLVAGVRSGPRAARARVLAGRGVGRPGPAGGHLRAPPGHRRRAPGRCAGSPTDALAAPAAGFTHLHVASSYSLRYGTATPAALAARAADLGMPALALTDRDGLYGAFKHVQACADAGIKPLLGADLPLLSPAGDDGDATGPGRVTLLATGRQGWASLCRLVSAAHADGGGGGRPAGREPARPTTTFPRSPSSSIAEHAAGLVVLLGPASDVGQAVAARRRDLARRALDRWRHLVRGAPSSRSSTTWTTSPRSAPPGWPSSPATAGTTAVLTNAVRYLDPADSLAAQVLDAARHLVPLGSPRLVPHNGRAYLAGPDDMTAIAERVAAAMTGPGTGERRRPGCSPRPPSSPAGAARPGLRPGRRHPSPAGDARAPRTTSSKELRDRCEHAILARPVPHRAARRPPARHQQAARRAATPATAWSTSSTSSRATGMAAYFLTVADVADRIRQAGIRCAIRGSGAGSFVNHLLGISAIDPLEHDLLMERFLSPIRATLPGHRPGRGVGPPPGRVPDHLRPLRRGAHRLRLHDGDLPGAQRDQGRRRRDVAAARRDRRDRQGLPAHPRQAHHGRARPSCRNSAGHGSTHDQLATIFSIAEQLDGLPRHVAMHPCGVLLSDRTLLEPDRGASQRRGLPAQPARQGRRGDRRGDQAGRARRPHAVRDGAHARRDRPHHRREDRHRRDRRATTRPPTR